MSEEEAMTRPLRSWRWLLPCAILPVVGFLIFSALGGKGCIQVLTGVQPFSPGQMAIGAGYLASYFALAVFSPVFVLAAGLIAVADRFRLIG